eukprot:CAMPEP_0170512744 /NCGR_PEP_ID=MMETSP0208-20121228/67018_1 /TAXON_ID=197538 /ORGANISM="Strombidium inclinatum, Strain S3" /LENGTH=100 /DNA_ID=CAMNT_0010796405 /DNA_START=2291 /DNA_END=2590 /DNA_ORIENTATION=+
MTTADAASLKKGSFYEGSSFGTDLKKKKKMGGLATIPKTTVTLKGASKGRESSTSSTRKKLEEMRPFMREARAPHKFLKKGGGSTTSGVTQGSQGPKIMR